MSVSSLSIPFFQSIEEYNFRINIEPPRYVDFDVRNFERNMETVRLKMPPFRIPFFQIALLESGGGTVAADGQAYSLNNFTLFFNLPNQIIFWDVPQDWKGYYLCIDESFYTVRIDNYQRLYDFPFFQGYTSGIQLTPEEAELILDLMKRMDGEYTNPTPYNKPIIKSLLSSVFSYSIRFYERKSKDEITQLKKSSLGDRFKQVVHDHISSMIVNLISGPLSVSGLADELSVTPKHLSETIKKDLGETPTDYINQRLIKEAQKLLKSTQLQIKEISYLLGFQDSSYFGRLFKKITGFTPANYRDNS